MFEKGPKLETIVQLLYTICSGRWAHLPGIYSEVELPSFLGHYWINEELQAYLPLLDAEDPHDHVDQVNRPF